MKLVTTRQFLRENQNIISENKLRTMIKQEQVPGLYSGNRFYINEEAFLDVMKAETTTAKNPIN